MYFVLWILSRWISFAWVLYLFTWPWIYVLPGKLQIAVFRALLIFQTKFIDNMSYTVWLSLHRTWGHKRQHSCEQFIVGKITKYVAPPPNFVDLTTAAESIASKTNATDLEDEIDSSAFWYRGISVEAIKWLKLVHAGIGTCISTELVYGGSNLEPRVTTIRVTGFRRFSKWGTGPTRPLNTLIDGCSRRRRWWGFSLWASYWRLLEQYC